MSRDNLTGDFLTDHPFVGIFLAGCLLSLVSSQNEKGAMDRYQIHQMEGRKQVVRDEFMRNNPFCCPDFCEEMADFCFGMNREQVDSFSETELFQHWNWLHAYMFFKLSMKEEDSQKNIEKIAKHWAESSTYHRLKENAWKRYLRWVDDQLILKGKI